VPPPRSVLDACPVHEHDLHPDSLVSFDLPTGMVDVPGVT
jgi:hypothetical protein